MKDNEIKNDFAALRRGEKLSWNRIGKLLLHVEKSRAWCHEAKSFTEWVKMFAAKMSCESSTLWRYLAAIRFYEQKYYGIIGVESFDPDYVSPESIELLAKIHRVAPPDMVHRLAKHVMKGTLTRFQLRQTWHALRPVLEGRTARGKGVSPPRYDPADRQQYKNRLVAMISATLASLRDSKWTGIADPELYELFFNPSVYRDGKPQMLSLDIVAVVRERSGGAPIFHGVQIVDNNVSRTARLGPDAPYCDALWLAIPGEIGMMSHQSMPDYLGILRLHNGSLRVERKPKRTGKVGTRTGELAKGLLLTRLRQ